MEDSATKKKIKTNEEAALAETDSTTNKKLLIIYILEVLQKYSDKNHWLTQADIIEMIKQDYGMDSERKAISRNLKLLIDHGYNIERNESVGGYCLTETDFSPEDVFMLWEGLMASKYISAEEMKGLVNKLNKYAGSELRLGESYYGGIINRYTYPETHVYGNLKFILTEMAVNKKISFKYNKYTSQKTLCPISDSSIRVNPYALLNVDNEYYLAAAVEGSTQMSCYKVGLISDLEVTEFLSDDITTIIGYDKGFEPMKFVKELIPGYGGTVTDCIVRVSEDVIDDIMAVFGEDFKIISGEDGFLTLDITTGDEKMYDWAIRHADVSEVIEPAALRFRIKEYFDRMCWKYR